MAVEGYHDATIEQAILALNDKALIDEISQLAVRNNCRISICHHKNEEKHNEINFCVELIDDSAATTIFNKAEISAHISDSLNYDKVTVNFRHFYSQEAFESLYEDVTLFTPENYNKIHAFFQKHYPECYQEARTVAHQDKRQRSVSPPRSSSFFPGNGSHLRDESNAPLTAEMLLSYLQQDSRIWEGIRRSPEVLDEACGCAKRVLSEVSTVGNSRPTGAAK